LPSPHRPLHWRRIAFTLDHMANTYRILAVFGSALLGAISLPAVSHAADGCGPGMYFNVQTNQCEWNGPVGPGPVGPGPVGPGPVGAGPVGPGPVGPGPVGPGPVGPGPVGPGPIGPPWG